MLFARLALAFALLFPSASIAAGGACPEESIVALHAQALNAQDLTPQDAMDTARQALATCGRDRVVLSLMMAVLAKAGGAVEPPSNARDALLFNAFNTAYEIAKNPVDLGDERRVVNPVGWTMADERAVYFGLTSDLAEDFFRHGHNAPLYSAAQQERFGCGLYPDQESRALALWASPEEAGKLRARVEFLATRCDTGAHDISGQAAQYWQMHHLFAVDDADYPMPRSEVDRQFERFLDLHLDGRASSSLFTAEDVSLMRRLLKN